MQLLEKERQKLETYKNLIDRKMIGGKELLEHTKLISLSYKTRKLLDIFGLNKQINIEKKFSE